ncbi:MAG: hypothetical protein NVS4B7_02500 [Ktedonobacteraceae bacterium]
MTQNIVPNPVQSAPAPANTASSSPKKGISSALFTDDTFVAIHDAFLLGWSLFELRSRILIATVPAFTTDPASSASAQPNQPSSPPVVLSPQITDVAGRASELVRSLMNDAINIVKSLPPVQKLVADFQRLPTDLVDNIWLTSVWRALFQNIVATHKSCLSGSDTHNTLYDPPDESAIIYLYPKSTPDYTRFGISSTTQLPDSFRLDDVMRRALNCLTLLLTDPNDSLIPDNIRALQDPLLKSITNNDNASSRNSSDKNTGIRILSGLNVTFLMQWDSYVRENLYASSNVGNNEIMLTAYEAGRSLASLSWSLSVVAVPLENAVQAAGQDQERLKDLAQKFSKAWLNAFDAHDIAYVQCQISALSTALDDAYYRVNTNIQRPDLNATFVQPNPALPSQSIHAITNSLDYWQRTVELMCNPSSTTIATQPSAASFPPTTTTRPPAVPPLDWERSRKLRGKLVEQAEAWQSLLLCQQTLQDFTSEKVTQRILQDCIADFEDAVRAAEDEIKATINKQAQSWLETHRPIVITAIILGILLLVLLVAAGVILYKTGQLQGIATALTLVGGGILGLFSAAIGRLTTLFSPASASTGQAGQAGGTSRTADTSSLTQRLEGLGFFGLAGSALTSSFRDAYVQITIDFAGLNHSVAITFPLIEFFVEHSIETIGTTPTSPPAASSTSGVAQATDNLIRDGYDFLTKVIWTQHDRAEEIQRIARAAFGPLGLFLGAQVSSAKKAITDQTSMAVSQVNNSRTASTR